MKKRKISNFNIFEGTSAGAGVLFCGAAAADWCDGFAIVFRPWQGSIPFGLSKVVLSYVFRRVSIDGDIAAEID
jgi:hypothetical protein